MTERFNDIARLVAAQRERFPDLDVLTFVSIAGDGALHDEARSFAQLYDNGARLALWLQEQGIGQGDHVVLMMQNHPEFVEAMIASALIGAIFVPIDPRSMGEKLTYMLNAVEARVAVVGDYALAALRAAASELRHLRTLMVIDAADSVEAPDGIALFHPASIPADASPLVTTIPDQRSPMFLMFTSGTTGNPKAVVRTHLAHMRVMRGLLALGVERTDILHTGLPLCHINAHATLSAALSLGIKGVISRKFTKTRLWDICRAYGCTVFTLLGGMIPEIFSVPERPDDHDNPVRLIIASGMPADLWRAYEHRFGVVITEVYGSTEARGVLINLKSSGPAGSMGKPPQGICAEILDEDGNPCPPDVPGELCFRLETGPHEQVEYFRNQQASADKVRDGWFRTGDIAHRDAEGWFWFRHRTGGGVRRNGDFVNTALVETVLATSPMVEDVFVYGVETARTVSGEKMLVAALVLTEGGTVDAARQWAASRLQKSEIPEIWQVLDAIPKTVSEKPIERECIAALHSAGLVPGEQREIMS
ncbi:MAG TPA: AMP-binding protein [Sphingobium sp.]